MSEQAIAELKRKRNAKIQKGRKLALKYLGSWILYAVFCEGRCSCTYLLVVLEQGAGEGAS